MLSSKQFYVVSHQIVLALKLAPSATFIILLLNVITRHVYLVRRNDSPIFSCSFFLLIDCAATFRACPTHLGAPSWDWSTFAFYRPHCCRGQFIRAFISSRRRELISFDNLVSVVLFFACHGIRTGTYCRSHTGISSEFRSVPLHSPRPHPPTTAPPQGPPRNCRLCPSSTLRQRWYHYCRIF